MALVLRLLWCQLGCIVLTSHFKPSSSIMGRNICRSITQTFNAKSCS
ncbi:hypothetical protein Lalb_Chr03g0035331 [Lupinus albus]|uniref:Uncharacterized protein n=1 Tax=Lupinus albus TaxID=3870 RepID=A0A6A4QVC7_LUPAL|nr:hypothetical protein Lalb_Chr03g0035331 [Lupinus albus]